MARQSCASPDPGFLERHPRTTPASRRRSRVGLLARPASHRVEKQGGFGGCGHQRCRSCRGVVVSQLPLLHGGTRVKARASFSKLDTGAGSKVVNSLLYLVIFGCLAWFVDVGFRGTTAKRETLFLMSSCTGLDRPLIGACSLSDVGDSELTSKQQLDEE
jgi:hypothetical protein